MDGIHLYNQFLALHKTQLEASAVPSHFWKTLHHKLSIEKFDAGVVFQLLLIDYDDDDDIEQDEEECAMRPKFALTVAHEEGLRVNDVDNIFLIDHAWTFRINTARQQLEQYEQLTDRLCAITGVDLEDSERVDKLISTYIWRYCHAYSLASNELTDEERTPIWYIMDEVGSAVNHSDKPNFRIVPFLYLNTQTTFSLLFPLRDSAHNEPVTRDFIEYCKDDATVREVLLLPWRKTDYRKESFIQCEPEAEYFLQGHIPETCPRGEKLQEPQIRPNETLKVFAEYDVVREHLTSDCFQLVDNKDDADILWLTHHFKNFAELAAETPNKFVNQFPYEYVLTIKDLLSITCRRAAKEHHNASTLETYPSWLPTTYNLKTELLQFVSYYQNRAAMGLNNHWIVKPWNLARALDTHITESLAYILRLPATGPKIAQKYIERPVLFQRAEINANVKFDVRYVILLKNVLPLEAYVHRKFFLRFANKSFSLDRFDEYEKHFTVMNYQENAELHHIKCDDFLNHWQEQYPAHSWTNIENNICHMLYELLECATKKAPPCGIPHCPQSRALYAADIMLEWEDSNENAEEQKIQPKLLEVNWTPDCKRACDYYPEFFNEIFKLLFLNELNDDSFRLLSKID